MSDSARPKRWMDPEAKPFLAGVAHGLIFALSWIVAFPGLGIWPLVVVGPAALARVAMRTPRPLRTALGAGLGSIPLWAWSHAFIIKISALGYAPLVIHLAVFPALFVWLCARGRRAMPDLPCWVLLPVMWMGIEVLRGEILWSGHPWFLVAHPLIPLGVLADYASVVGVYGVGAIVMASIGWGFDVVHWTPSKDPASVKRGKHLRSMGIVGALVFFLGAALMWPYLGEDRDTILVGVVQTNVPQDNKMQWSLEDRERDLTRFLELTSIAASGTIGGEPRGTPDLIVWPETMFPGHFGLDPETIETLRNEGIALQGRPATAMHDALVAHQGAMGIPMVVGGVASDGLRFGIDEETGLLLAEQDAVYNSAFVIVDGAVSTDRYDKMYLTPFGEVMPYISAWPWLESKLLDLGARGMAFDLEAGLDSAPLTIPLAEGGTREAQDLALAAPICFEATNTQVCRDLVYTNGERRARLLVNLTNDGWYSWYAGGREHHLLHARWRCVELGTPMIRAANTGISALIDARGKVIARGVNMPEERPAIGSEGVLYGQLRLPEPEERTIYAQLGNALGWSLLGAMIVLIAMTFRATSRGREGAAGEREGPELRLVGGDASADESGSDVPNRESSQRENADGSDPADAPPRDE